jgi:hypothetical protein
LSRKNFPGINYGTKKEQLKTGRDEQARRKKYRARLK